MCPLSQLCHTPRLGWIRKFQPVARGFVPGLCGITERASATLVGGTPRVRNLNEHTGGNICVRVRPDRWACSASIGPEPVGVLLGAEQVSGLFKYRRAERN